MKMETSGATYGGWAYLRLDAGDEDGCRIVLDWLDRLERAGEVLWLHNVPLGKGRELLLLARYRERQIAAQEVTMVGDPIGGGGR